MGHATGLLLAEKLSFLEDNEIPLSLLQYVESDAPNVDKTVWNKFDEQISALPERKEKGQVNMSTCNLHICHNAFQNSLQVFAEDLSELAITVVSLYGLYGLSRLLPDVKTLKILQRKLGLQVRKYLTHEFLNQDGSTFIVNC